MIKIKFLKGMTRIQYYPLRVESGTKLMHILNANRLLIAELLIASVIIT